MFDGGDTNLYGYVMNDPVNFIDSSGKYFEDFLGNHLTPKQQGAVGAGMAAVGGALMYGSMNPFAPITFGAGAYLGYEGGKNLIRANDRGLIPDIMNDIIPPAEAGENQCTPRN